MRIISIEPNLILKLKSLTKVFLEELTLIVFFVITIFKFVIYGVYLTYLIRPILIYKNTQIYIRKCVRRAHATFSHFIAYTLTVEGSGL